MQPLKVYAGKIVNLFFLDVVVNYDRYRSLSIRLDSDPKCGEALLTQLSARLASGHITDKYVLLAEEIPIVGSSFRSFDKYLRNIYRGHWMFNLVLFDAAPFKRRSSIRHGVDKEKYESLL